MTAKSTPTQIAQRAVDAAQKRVDKADDDIKKAQQTLSAALVEKAEAEALRDFRKGHPALKRTIVTDPATGAVTASGGQVAKADPSQVSS